MDERFFGIGLVQSETSVLEFILHSTVDGDLNYRTHRKSRVMYFFPVHCLWYLGCFVYQYGSFRQMMVLLWWIFLFYCFDNDRMVDVKLIKAKTEDRKFYLTIFQNKKKKCIFVLSINTCYFLHLCRANKFDDGFTSNWINLWYIFHYWWTFPSLFPG